MHVNNHTEVISFRLLNIIYAKNRTAALPGKHNHSRFDKRSRVAG